MEKDEIGNGPEAVGHEHDFRGGCCGGHQGCCDEPKEESELERLESELYETKERYLGLLADQDNIRKRLQKEKYDSIQLALDAIVSDLLDPIDHFRTALDFAKNLPEGETKRWLVGLEMIWTRFQEVLASHDIHPFTSVGTMFNPVFHEAVELLESNEVAPGIVIRELQKGYKSGDRVLRHARVAVAEACKVEPITQPEHQNEAE